VTLIYTISTWGYSDRVRAVPKKADQRYCGRANRGWG